MTYLIQLLTDGCEITINEKFYDDEPLIRGLKSDAEPENLTQEQFKEFINQYEEHGKSKLWNLIQLIQRSKIYFRIFRGIA